MILCAHCQRPVPEGVLACRECHTPIDHSAIIAGNLKAAAGAEYIVGGINWGAVLLGGLMALAIWNGGMQVLTLLFGGYAFMLGIMVKISAVFAGSFFAGYRSYSAELTHGLLVAAIVAGVNGLFFVFLIGAEMTMYAVLIDFIFIDFGAALFGSFLGAKAQD